MSRDRTGVVSVCSESSALEGRWRRAMIRLRGPGNASDEIGHGNTLSHADRVARSSPLRSMGNPTRAYKGLSRDIAAILNWFEGK